MAEQAVTNLSGTPVIFGEVLFDRFPDGKAVLGGAPFNVAWHLQGFGLSPLLISRIGNDEPGTTVRTSMQAWGMSTAGLQEDDHHPTGTVNISLSPDGQPSFEILADQAYDHIESETAERNCAGQELSLLYHGSLATRSPGSAATLQALQQRFALPTFIDINLRTPWWTHSQLTALLTQATWLKLNDAELCEIGRHPADCDYHSAAAQLRRDYPLDWLIVTRGAAGALLLGPETELTGEPVPVPQMMDTVGAGDAFSAVVILGLHRGWSDRQILQRALEFASAICGVRGATTDDTTLYQNYLNAWRQ